MATRTQKIQTSILKGLRAALVQTPAHIERAYKYFQLAFSQRINDLFTPNLSLIFYELLTMTIQFGTLLRTGMLVLLLEPCTRWDVSQGSELL